MAKTRPTPTDFVEAGQRWTPPKARLHNAWTEAAMALDALPTPQKLQTLSDPHHTHLFVKDGETTVSPFGVVGYADPVEVVGSIDDAARFTEPIFDYAAPSTGRWGIAQNGLPGKSQNAVEAIILQGTTWAQVVIDDVDHDFAEINLSGVLASASEGLARILWKPGGTGIKWVVLYLGCCGGTNMGELNPLGCECFDFPMAVQFCRVFLGIRQVAVWDDSDPPGVYGDPGVCEPGVPLFPPSGPPHTPCTSCVDWNKDWEVFKEVVTPQNSCRFGVEQIGSEVPEPFPATAQFPCAEYGDATYIAVNFACPNPADSSGSASVTIELKGCVLMSLQFEDVFYDTTYEPIGNQTNRVSSFTLPYNLNPGGSACWCRISTHRDPGDSSFQGGWDPTNIPPEPNLQDGTGTKNHWYTVSVAGTHDFGNGNVSLQVNDIVVYQTIWGLNRWVVIPNSGGAIDSDTFIPGEFDPGDSTYFAIDKDGCDWTDALNNGQITFDFEECP